MTEQTPESKALEIINKAIKDNCEQCGEVNCPISLVELSLREYKAPHCYNGNSNSRFNSLNKLLIDNSEVKTAFTENEEKNPLIIALEKIECSVFENKK